MPDQAPYRWNDQLTIPSLAMRKARKAYLDQWRDRMAIAYTAGCTDAGAIVERRGEMAWKEHT